MKLSGILALSLIFALCCAAGAPAQNNPGGNPGPNSPPEPLVAARSASIVLKVPDFSAARSRILAIGAKFGAQLRDAKTSVNLNGQKQGQLTLQIDARNLDLVVDDVRKVGKLYSEHIQTTDRTSYYDQLDQRSALLRQNEAELQDFLHRPRHLRGSDILFVQARLFQTRVEAADASQERQSIERSSRRSLINVLLFEPEPRQMLSWGDWHSHAVYRAKASFLDVFRKAITGIYIVLWFTPFWLPAAVILFFLYKWLRRRINAIWAQWPRRGRSSGPSPQEQI